MIRIVLTFLLICTIGKTHCQTNFQTLAKLKGIDRINGFENYYYQNIKKEPPTVIFNHANIIKNMSENDKELFVIFRYIELLYWTEREERIDLRNKYGKELDSLLKIMPTNETLAYLKAYYENIYGYSVFLETGSHVSVQLLQNSILFFQQKNFENISNFSTKITKLGNVYLKNMLYEDAFYCFTQAVNYNTQAIDKEVGIHAYNGLGLSYKNLKKYDAAIDAFKEAKKLAEKSNNFLAVGFLIGNIAKCYLKLGKTAEAEEAFLEEIKLLDDMLISANSLSLAEAYSGLTLIAALKNQKAQTNIYEAKSDSYIKLIDSTELKRYIETWIAYNENMALAFKHIGESDKSLSYAMRWIEAEKMQNESAKTGQILRITTEFNTAFYKAEKEKVEHKHRIVSNWLMFCMICIVFILSVFVYVYIRFKGKIKATRQNLEQTLMAHQKTDMLFIALKEKEANMQAELSEQEAKSQFLTEDLEEKQAIIDDLNEQLSQYKQKEIREDFVYDKTTKIIDELKTLVITEKNWERFIVVLEQAYPHFLDKIQTEIPALTPADIRLLSLLKLKLDTRQISEILGISVSSIYTSKYRLRQKIKHLPQGDEIVLLLK